MLGAIQDSFGRPVDTSQFSPRTSSVEGANYNLYNGPTDAAVSALDTSGLDGTQVRDALYRKATATLDPQYKQAEDDMRTRLLNSGVREGSEAFNREMDAFGRQRQSDYGDARDRSILAEGSERSRMLAEILAGGTFANDAQQQTIGNRMAATGMNNQVASQGLQDRIAQGNFANTQRGAEIDEAAYLRSLPLNEYAALTSGTQVTNPSFRGTGQVQGPAAAPVFAGAQAQGQSAIDLYNAQMASANSARAGVAGLFGSGLQAAGAAGGFGTLFSDRRLKSRIRQIGKMSGTGLPVYSYVIAGTPAIGVMSDEVRGIHPDAVMVDPASGYDKVDYARITGTVEF